MACRYHKGPSELDFVAGADYTAGDLIEVAGKAGLVQNDIANGQLGSVTIEGLVYIPNSGVIFADGATVEYDISDGDAVATSSTGDFVAGICVGGAAASEDVLVLLNG